MMIAEGAKEGRYERRQPSRRDKKVQQMFDMLLREASWGCIRGFCAQGLAVWNVYRD